MLPSSSITDVHDSVHVALHNKCSPSAWYRGWFNGDILQTSERERKIKVYTYRKGYPSCMFQPEVIPLHHHTIPNNLSVFMNKYEASKKKKKKKKKENVLR